MRVKIVVNYGTIAMNSLTQAELSSQLKLINVAEIEILQAVLVAINTPIFPGATVHRTCSSVRPDS